MNPDEAPALMAHQLEGLEFLLTKKAGLLAYEQGLGKTAIAIESGRRLIAAGHISGMLVLCPNSLKRNWASEIHRFAPSLDICIIEGNASERRRLLGTTKAAVVVVNYESARAEIPAIRAIMLRRKFALVLDEAHHAKTFRSLTSIAIRHLVPLAEYRWLLTGTPVTNRPLDLYSQLGIIAEPNPLGSFEAFNAVYGGPSTTQSQLQELRKKIQPYILRRTKEECLDLPEKIFVDITVDLPPWQRRLYDQMRDEMVCEIEKMTQEQFAVYAPSALAQLLRLSQLASNPALIFPAETRVPGKFEELDRLVQELVADGGRKMIIWSYYVGTLRELARRYSDLGTVTLYGGVDTEERQAVAAAFQSDPAIRLLVANPAAAGTGFTLTASSFTIYETLSWRYDHYAQSQDRNHRIGQQAPVTYIRLIAADTVELAMVQALERKASQAATILGDKDAATEIADLTPEGFCVLLRTGRWPARY